MTNVAPVNIPLDDCRNIARDLCYAAKYYDAIASESPKDSVVLRRKAADARRRAAILLLHAACKGEPYTVTLPDAR